MNWNPPSGDWTGSGGLNTFVHRYPITSANKILERLNTGTNEKKLRCAAAQKYSIHQTADGTWVSDFLIEWEKRESLS